MSSMLYQTLGSCGSFKANGAGFYYTYHAENNGLAIFRNISGCKTLNITLPQKIKDNPQLFVSHLEKATQIRALMLSNNATIKLCETIVPEKLAAIAKSVSRLALNSYDLSNNNVDRFANILRRGFGLKELDISYIDHAASGEPYYKAKIITKKDNCLVVRDNSLPVTLKKLSDGIVSDMIMREFTSHTDQNSQNLLRLSTRISVISKILNESFIPERFLMNQTDSLSKTII